MPSVSVSALILAGGASSRFGGPKALVELAGRPLIAHVADVLSPLAGELIVSVADRDQASRLRSVLPGAVFVRDAGKGRGPIEGFRQGFDAAHGEVLLVAPCDAPLLRPQFYELLLTNLGDYDAAVPKIDVFDPVRAVYRRVRVLEVLQADPGIVSPSGLVDRLRTVFVTANQIRTIDPSLWSFLDVNTVEDLRLATEKSRLPRKDANGDLP